ncbi:hypothetical protein ACOSP7_028529 [Xanthoceras sorbifolium]
MRSESGYTNTLAGNVAPKANLGDLQGIEWTETSSMVDGIDFDDVEAYKDNKACNTLRVQQFQRTTVRKLHLHRLQCNNRVVQGAPRDLSPK